MGYTSIPGPENAINSANSTLTALAGGASFTGDYVDVSYTTAVVVACKADVAGTLYMEFSRSGTGTADSTLTYAVTGGINEVHRLTVTRPFYRSRFVNGSSAQSTFELTTMVGDYASLSAPLNLSLGQDADAIAVRVKDTETDIAEGKRAGYILVNKFGRNSNVSTADVPEDIWEGGGVYTGFPLGSAELVTVSSTDANDTAAGSGARTVRIYGLDANGALQEEAITLLGATLVDSVNTYTRVNRAIVLTSGSSNQAFNAGTITIAHKVTTANIFAKIQAGTNQTAIACYTIPAGYTGYMRQIDVGVSRSNTATVTGVIWARNNGASPRYIETFSASNTDSHHEIVYGGISFTSLTDIAIRITACSANNVPITSHFDIILVKD